MFDPSEFLTRFLLDPPTDGWHEIDNMDADDLRELVKVLLRRSEINDPNIRQLLAHAFSFSERELGAMAAALQLHEDALMAALNDRALPSARREDQGMISALGSVGRSARYYLVGKAHGIRDLRLKIDNCREALFPSPEEPA